LWRCRELTGKQSLNALFAEAAGTHKLSNDETLYLCSYFPAMYYLASSKLNVALLGNLAFVITLSMYKLALKVRLDLHWVFNLFAVGFWACWWGTCRDAMRQC
jgi:hypothetical protein